MSNDLPYYETLYGVYLDHWTWTSGHSGATVINDSHYMLTKEYFNDGCITTDSSTCTAGSNLFLFMYPHWIKKQYYVEGVIEGQFCVSCDGASDTIETYTIRLMRIDDANATSVIGTTGVITLNYALTWDGSLSVGDELVIPFFIEITPEEKMLDKERMYIEITIVSTSHHTILYHSNDATWQDIKIAIPLRGL